MQSYPSLGALSDRGEAFRSANPKREPCDHVTPLESDRRLDEIVCFCGNQCSLLINNVSKLGWRELREPVNHRVTI